MFLSVLFFASCEKIDENEFPEVVSSFAEISSFNVNDKYSLVIDTVNNKISGVLPPIVDIKAITPTIIISRGATIVPASSTVQDFTNPVSYQIIARNGVFKSNYEVDIEISGIVSFSIGDSIVPINYETLINSYIFPEQLIFPRFLQVSPEQNIILKICRSAVTLLNAP